MTGTEVGICVAVFVGVKVGVTVGDRLGSAVILGGKVEVFVGVIVWAAGWKGVAVIVAFGLAVTKLKVGIDAVASSGPYEQDGRIIRPKKMPKI